MKKFIKRIFVLYKPFRWSMIIVFLFVILAQALSLVSPYIYGKIIDGIISGSPMKDVIILAGFSLALDLFNSVVINYLRERFEIEKIDFDVSKFVSINTMEKMLTFSVGQHCNQNSDVKQSVINKGENCLTNLTYTILFNALPMFVNLILTISILLYMSVVLGLITLVGTFCFLGVSFYLNKIMGGKLKDIEDVRHDTNKTYSEILRNISLVQINSQEKSVVKKFSNQLGGLCGLCKDIWKKYAFWACIRNILISITRFAVIVVGVYYVYNDVYTAGYLVMFITWSSRAFGRIGSFGNLHRKCTELYVAVQKYFSMFDIEPAIKIVDNPVMMDNLKGEIIFKNVSFCYPVREDPEDNRDNHEIPKSGEKTLSNVSFTIESGQKVAFVGHSGAGKSTIANLILRAYDPTEGQIVVDQNDLRVVDLKSFRESVGIVEQDVTLFDETLRYNIVFGLNGKGVAVTEEELDEIAQASCVDKFFHRLEKGFDTFIGERGVKLSGGERQRVGIARALAKDPKILIFDEATSSLDTENETAIRQSIEKASKGRTTIIIAHRLSTIKNTDKIFVMEKGQIVCEGTHDELLETCDIYSNLVNNQV